MSVASTGSQYWQETIRFADLLTRAAERDPDHEAVVFPDGRITYGELQGRSFAVARALLDLGVGQRDRVGILMANCLEFVELLLAIRIPTRLRWPTPRSSSARAAANERSCSSPYVIRPSGKTTAS